MLSSHILDLPRPGQPISKEEVWRRATVRILKRDPGYVEFGANGGGLAQGWKGPLDAHWKFYLLCTVAGGLAVAPYIIGPIIKPGQVLMQLGITSGLQFQVREVICLTIGQRLFYYTGTH